MKFAVAGLTLAAAIVSGGWTQHSENYRPLILAFTTPVEELRQRAVDNDHDAEFALSVLATLGLRGVPEDPVLAHGLMNRAGFHRERVDRLQLCAVALVSEVSAAGGNMMCGGPIYQQLAPLAAPAAAEFKARADQEGAASAARTPLP